MYNFLKYKHNWKRCPCCSGKMIKTIFKGHFNCVVCKERYHEIYLKRRMKRRYNV